MADSSLAPRDATDVASIETALTTGQTSRKRRIVAKFLLAAIGAIPWVGGFLSAAASIKGDEEDVQKNDLQTSWLSEHQKKIKQLGDTLGTIETRFEKLGPEVDERVQSDEYLALVRRAFRTWDSADTDEKRRYAANLVTNAAGSRICSDDVVRLFIDWLDLYHEVHFGVIREIFRSPGSTRYEIWTALYGEELPREDSAEADLFKLMIRDLSTGRRSSSGERYKRARTICSQESAAKKSPCTPYNGVGVRGFEAVRANGARAAICSLHNE